MKNIKRFMCFIITALMMTPLLGWSNGAYNPGIVQVQTNSWIAGMYSVRYNPAVSQGRVGIAYWGTGLQIFGNDSSTGMAFGCYVFSSDPLFPQAEKIALAAVNGSYIVANKDTTTGLCSSVQLQSSSAYQN